MSFHKNHVIVESLENEKYSGNIHISYTTRSFRTDITISLILDKDKNLTGFDFLWNYERHVWV